MSASHTGYPFSAVVGQDRLRLALILTAIAPRIGGVVVRGEKGTAKTTTVRGFASLIDGPLINLPLGATEDRLVGSIDVETVLTTGKAQYKPGLLAEAHGGVLYVDEVNLLADHLVDSLLDAAATGLVTIERDGISFSSPANFVLVGTMNPEEGELRPQLLDRFGLAVEVTASRDVEDRTEIMRRRLAYEDNPAEFIRTYAEEDQLIAHKVKKAQAILKDVELSDAMLSRIALLCASFDVDGMRADLVIARTATAHAAWRGDTTVTDEDIRVAAELALPHRRRRNPFDETGLDEEQLNEALDEAEKQFPEQPDAQEPQQPEDAAPQEDNVDQPPQEPPAGQDSSDQPTQDGKAGQAQLGASFRH